MPFVPLNVVLDRPLPVSGIVNLPYPAGKNDGYFFAGYNHTMSIDGVFFRCPRDFILSTQPDRIVMTWRGEFQIPAGSLLNIQLDAPGGDFYFDQRTGVTVQNMVPCNNYMVNLGSPKPAEQDFFVSSTSIDAPKALKLQNQKPDYSRNIVIHSSADISHCTFTIEGEDLYARGMLEKITGPSNGSAHGNKSFTIVHKITVNHPCNGEVSIGTGDKLGLPMFLPSKGFLIKEMFNGEPITGSQIISGETSPPTATTGDCRGTYTPPEDVVMDGQNCIYLIFALPNPGNIGMPDYTG